MYIGHHNKKLKSGRSYYHLVITFKNGVTSSRNKTSYPVACLLIKLNFLSL